MVWSTIDAYKVPPSERSPSLEHQYASFILVKGGKRSFLAKKLDGVFLFEQNGVNGRTRKR